MEETEKLYEELINRINKHLELAKFHKEEADEAMKGAEILMKRLRELQPVEEMVFNWTLKKS
jgi:hypothetical protein